MNGKRSRRAAWLAVKRSECAARYVAAGWEQSEAEGAAAFARSLGF